MIANIGARAAQTVVRQGAKNAQSIGKTVINSAKAAEPMMNSTKNSTMKKASDYFKLNSDIKGGSNDAAKELRRTLSGDEIDFTSAFKSTATAFMKGAAPPPVIMGGMALHAAFAGSGASQTASSDQPSVKPSKIISPSSHQTTSEMMKELRLKAQLSSDLGPAKPMPGSIADIALGRFAK